MNSRSGFRAGAIFALCAVLVPMLATPLPGLAQANFSPELEPLVRTYVSGHGTPELKAKVDAYVAAHPNDGDGLALQCAMEEADAYASKSDILPLLPKCQKAVTLAPQSSFANYVAGDAFYDADSIAQSARYYTKAIDLGMTGAGVYWKRCDAYRRTGDLTSALTDCKRQLELTPNEFHAVYGYGHLQYARAQYADAVTYLSRALSVQPDNIDALYWRGMSYGALGQLAQAEADFTRCIALGDESADTYAARGQIRRNLGKTAAATADLQEAVRRYRSAGMNEQADRVGAILADSQTGVPKPITTAPSSRSFTIDGVSFDAVEVARLFRGVNAAFSKTDHSVHIALALKPAGQMPAYDPQWHYVSAQSAPDGTPSITGWVLATLPHAEMPSAFEAIALVGLADSGYAGPKWKALYDRFAAQDAALGPNAADPFVMRRKFADQMVKLFQAFSVWKTKKNDGSAGPP